jgi:Tfp pilus assembly protein PilF
MKANTKLDDPATRSEGCAQLRTISQTARDPAVRLNAAKAVAIAFNNDKNWEETVKAAKDGLAIAPDDVMLNNNLACVLAEELKRCDEALPYAEKAMKASPEDLNIIDTMATVQWCRGEKDKAIQTASGALRLTRTDADKAPVMLKIARWRLETGDKAAARRLLDMLRETISDNPAADKDLKAKVDQFKKDFDAAP